MGKILYKNDRVKVIIKYDNSICNIEAKEIAIKLIEGDNNYKK